MTQIIAMCVFSLTMSITPGPVNMTIVASGATYGFKRTIPFVSGATIGFILLLLILGLGFMQVIVTYPVFLKYMSISGSIFILYISYKISISIPEMSIHSQKCPNFTEGFLLQWLNPKAWLACVAGISLFADDKSLSPLFLFVTLYLLICYVSLASWALLGDRLSSVLGTKTRLRIFNCTMALMLSSCAVYLLYTAITDSFIINNNLI
jgi:threonine/homoserine/homoserine lactone efflux protein